MYINSTGGGGGGGQTETSRHLKTGWSNSTHTDVVTHLAKSHQARHNTTASARLRVWMSEEKCRQILWSKPPPSPKTLIIPFSISFYWLTFSITRRWGHPKEKKKKKSPSSDFISRASWKQILAWWGTGSKDTYGYSRGEILSSWSRHKEGRESGRLWR